MPSANAFLAPSRANDADETDQIGSNSSTPPGAATPRPDPTDKRLPGILHSYFGQVRDSLISRRPSAINPSPAPTASPAQDRTQDAAPKEEDGEASRLRSNTLPSPTPSASSRHPSTSQSKGETEKLTEGDFAPPQNQATPPHTPRSRSQEGKPPTSSLSSTSLASYSKAKEGKATPAVGPPKGKLSVSITEGKDLRPSVDPYVVCQFQWAEYISDGPKNEGAPNKAVDGGRNAGGLSIRRTDSDMGRPMAIPMRSRQSSNSGVSSDPRENGTFKEVTNPKWEHDAIL